MSEDLVKRVRAVQFSQPYCKEAVGTPCRDWDTSHDLSLITEDGSRVRVGTFKHAEWAARALAS